MIHRALFGSMERFVGVLIEHFAGAFPVWLAPVQAVVLPVSDRHVDYARGCAPRWTASGSRSTSARNRSGARSATPNCVRSPTCWSWATVRLTSARSPSAATAEGDQGALSLDEVKAKLSDPE